MNYKTLAGCAAAITTLWLLRFVISGESIFRYSFIVWNVFLATIPLLLEPVFRYVYWHWHGTIRRVGQLMLAATWMLFLPNAFYVLTDFMHLNAGVLVNNRGLGNHYVMHYQRGDGLYIFDSLLLFVATAFTAYLGGLALMHAYSWLRRHFAPLPTGLIMGFILGLSSIGVYIGRYARWNSWDGLSQPWRVAADLVSSLHVSAVRERFLDVVLTMLIFQGICWWVAMYYERLVGLKLTHRYSSDIIGKRGSVK